MNKFKDRGSIEIVILVIVLAVVVGLVVWRIADTMKTQQDTEAAVNSNQPTSTGNERVASVLTLPDYQLSLNVIEAGFEAGDIGFSKVDEYYILTSRTLRDNKNPSCTETDGRFASVTGSEQPEENGIGQEGKKIGAFYYYVLPINLIDCYPQEYVDKYMTPQAYNSLKDALIATSDL